VGKLNTNLIVAVCAFLIGIASAMAFNKLNAEDQSPAVPSIHSDPMGNVRAIQD
jgi:hypothetical protein